MIGFGGYGGLINDGLSRDFNTPVVVGASLSIVMALAIDLVLVIIERLLTPWTRAAPLMDALSEFWTYVTTAENWWGNRGIAIRVVGPPPRSSGFSLLAAVGPGPARRRSASATSSGAGSLAVWLVNIGRAVPSFAIIVLVFPLSLRYGFGLGFWPTAFALVLLAIPPDLHQRLHRRARRRRRHGRGGPGDGHAGREVLWGVEIPAALPLIITGLRVSAVQVVATATLGAYVGFGGLGAFIVEGFATQNDGKLLTGAILVGVLSLVVELVFGLAAASSDSVDPGSVC